MTTRSEWLSEINNLESRVAGLERFARNVEFSGQDSMREPVCLFCDAVPGSPHRSDCAWAALGLQPHPESQSLPKPWENPQIVNRGGRWVVMVPVDNRVCQEYDITEAMLGWLHQEVKVELSGLSDEVKANGAMLLRWLQNNPNPPGINLYALGNWLLTLAALIKKD